MKVTRKLVGIIVVLTCCFLQQGVVVALAQEQQPNLAGGQTESEVTPKSGIAGGGRSPALTGVRRPLYRLCKSDVLVIHFTFSPEFDQTASVQPDGYISLKGIVEPLPAEGVTVPELKDLIVRAYNGVLRDPEVSIELKDFDKPSFIVAGEVNRQGRYELRSDITVTEAVAVAGGLTPRAKHSQVVLFRQVSDQLVESHVLDVKAMLKSRTLAEDMHVRPGDLAFVPQNVISKVKQYLPTSILSLYANPTQF